MSGLIAQVVILASLAGTVGLSLGGWVAGLTCAVTLAVAVARGLARCRADALRAADWVTLARASLGIAAAALVADSFTHPARVALLVSVSAVALTLDFVDGWVARRTRTAGTFGALFDGEVDAFLILVLSVYVSRVVGVWVLAIGAARYVFFAAGWPMAWLRAPLPPRYWRKVVAATQGIVLTVAAAGVLPRSLTDVGIVVALVLLGESFGRDVIWLWNHRAVASAVDAVAARARTRGRVRASIAAGLTLLAVLIVWTALVAPDQPQNLTATAFLRVPLEGLVLVALGAVLPPLARLLLAAAGGLALGLVVILKVLDIGFFTAFARPFNPVGDLGNVGDGIETLRATIGRTHANLLIAAGVAGAVAIVLLTTLALVRLMHVAGHHRRWSLRVVTALGALWLVLATSGAQLLTHTAIASTSTAGFVVGEVRMVQADLHDYGVFARQIREDRFRSTPGNRLLTALHGKDVLLVFVESYGQVSVQGSFFSPAVDALLKEGTNRLRIAGFSARSGFVDAPGFGGASWLAHATLQSGAWANSQQRYNQLVGSNRFTLTGAFNRAGWRTINFAPADDRDWSDGSSFYHYARLYDRRDMNYHGPTFSYAPMPDQFMFAALQRLVLSQADRPPLFAEVDTVSSHMPWNRIPRMVPWSALGDGSIFNRVPMDHETGAFWSNPRRVKAAYARSLEYSLDALISFVQRYGRKNLVLIVVGDEQPLPIVSGHTANHVVPISIIAHDASVLARIDGWNWQGGLLPGPRAPVWAMSAFRDRFLTAYGSQPTTGHSS